jgi:hypothetical protein
MGTEKMVIQFIYWAITFSPRSLSTGPTSFNLSFLNYGFPIPNKSVQNPLIVEILYFFFTDHSPFYNQFCLGSKRQTQRNRRPANKRQADFYFIYNI